MFLQTTGLFDLVIGAHQQKHDKVYLVKAGCTMDHANASPGALP